jgi:hypothetical protein
MQPRVLTFFNCTRFFSQRRSILVERTSVAWRYLGFSSSSSVDTVTCRLRVWVLNKSWTGTSQRRGKLSRAEPQGFLADAFSGKGFIVRMLIFWNYTAVWNSCTGHLKRRFKKSRKLSLEYTRPISNWGPLYVYKECDHWFTSACSSRSIPFGCT